MNPQVLVCSRYSPLADGWVGLNSRGATGAMKGHPLRWPPRQSCFHTKSMQQPKAQLCEHEFDRQAVCVGGCLSWPGRPVSSLSSRGGQGEAVRQGRGRPTSFLVAFCSCIVALLNSIFFMLFPYKVDAAAGADVLILFVSFFRTEPGGMSSLLS